MVRVPDASGVLTGKVNEKTVFEKNDHRSSRKREWIVEAIQKVEKMKPIGLINGWNIAQLAIKFILSQKEVSVVLPTVIDMDELEMLLKEAEQEVAAADSTKALALVETRYLGSKGTIQAQLRSIANRAVRFCC